MSGKPHPKRRTEAWDAEVGRRIRARRNECGLSQEELARGIGVSFQQVQKYEKGVNRVSAGRLLRIGEVLQVPMTFFYAGGAGDESGPTRFAPTRLFDYLKNRDTQQLVVAFNRLPDRNLRRTLVRLVERIAHAGSAARKRSAAAKDHRRIVPRGSA